MTAWLDRKTIELNDEEFAILEHAYKSQREVFCGDSREMQTLVAYGLMTPLRRVSWCPDRYFQLTPEGGIQFRRNKRERKFAARTALTETP